ncbi:MAG: hypothetical protein SFW36_00965 [Leptolyngbyaceae cyanobacterium bins.59]|nr:hypothetical protein [Leptolyngbyaceae cyanobacterium bins.59]
MTRRPKVIVAEQELEDFVQLTLSAPDEVRRSSRNAGVLLFYRVRREERWVVAVARRLMLCRDDLLLPRRNIDYGGSNFAAIS